MEFLLTSFAGKLGERVVGAVDNRKTDHAIVHSLKTLVHVPLPQDEPIHDTAVLE